MKYAIFRNEGTLTSATERPRKVVGRRVWPAMTYPTIAAARSAWYDADMGNGNQILILPAYTPEFSYYPPRAQATVEAKRQRRARTRAISRRQLRSLKEAQL